MFVLGGLAAQNKPRSSNSSLSISKSELYVDFKKGTTKVYVTSNTTWHLKNTKSDFFTVARNNDELIISYETNPEKYVNRNGFFDVVTDNGLSSKRIRIYQSACNFEDPTEFTAKNVSVKINKIWCEHNVYKDGKKGMNIHVDAHAINAKDMCLTFFLWFYKYDGMGRNPINYLGDSRYTNYQKNIFMTIKALSMEQNMHLSDESAFFPYEELHGEGKFDFDLTIGTYLMERKWYYFASASSRPFIYSKSQNSGREELISDMNTLKYVNFYNDLRVSMTHRVECTPLLDDYNKQLQNMHSEYTKKYNEYTNCRYIWSASVSEFRLQELEELVSRMYQFKNNIITAVEECSKEQIITVQGLVMNSKGKFLKGVSVTELNNFTSTTTDKNGFFTITTYKNADIRFLHPNYIGKTIKAGNLEVWIVLEKQK